MPRIAGGVLAVVVMVVAQAGVAGAVFAYQPSPADLNDLDHAKAYRWGLRPSLPDGDEIESASITFSQIRNWAAEPNHLWVTLLDSAPEPLKTYTDNEAYGNYFGTFPSASLLKHYQNLGTTSITLTYNFTADQLITLNSYAGDGNFGLGFDPDCHFYNSGITLTLETRPMRGDNPGVPEPLGVTVLVGGLLGMIAGRRRR